jgi:hypothetical protein
MRECKVCRNKIWPSVVSRDGEKINLERNQNKEKVLGMTAKRAIKRAIPPVRRNHSIAMETESLRIKLP